MAVGLNLAIGIAVFVWQRARGSAASKAAPPADEPVISTSLPHGLTGAVLFLSGFATLCYEIIWLRSLRYLFGNSTYALTVLLVTFLLGLGFGGQLLGPLARRRSPERDLAVCQLVIGLFALLAIALAVAVLGDQTSGSLATQLSVFGAARYDPWTQRPLGASLASLGMMLPATLLMGLSFPMFSETVRSTPGTSPSSSSRPTRALPETRSRECLRTPVC